MLSVGVGLGKSFTQKGSWHHSRDGHFRNVLCNQNTNPQITIANVNPTLKDGQQECNFFDANVVFYLLVEGSMSQHLHTGSTSLPPKAGDLLQLPDPSCSPKANPVVSSMGRQCPALCPR